MKLRRAIRRRAIFVRRFKVFGSFGNRPESPVQQADFG
jgi:hypothetical protein